MGTGMGTGTGMGMGTGVGMDIQVHILVEKRDTSNKNKRMENRLFCSAHQRFTQGADDRFVAIQYQICRANLGSRDKSVAPTSVHGSRFVGGLRMPKYSRSRLVLVEPGVAPAQAAVSKRKRRPVARCDFYAMGPIPISVAGAAGRAGPWCLPVLLAARAWSDMTSGGPVQVAWTAAVLGANVRSVQRAVSALIDAGMLVRSDEGIVVPSWSELHRHRQKG